MNGRTFTHYAHDPIGKLYDTRDKQGIDHKPVGLWLSADGEDDWANWCNGESFPIGSHPYSIVLSEQATICWLENSQQIDAFHNRFSANPEWAGDRYAIKYIDWRLVAATFDGIVIAPYCWERRLDGDAHSWYYSWDCASGCIWSPFAVASIAPKKAQAA